MVEPLVRSCLLNSGHKMPLMGLGTWQLRSTETNDLVCQVVNDALNLGYKMIDTATSYNNESNLGRSLKELLPKYNLSRSDIFITSKLATGDQGFDSAYKACLQSIEKLQCDYLDLYLIHWPGAANVKSDDPKNRELRIESWKALEKLKSEGHVRSIGVSNYVIRHLEEMSSYASVSPAVNQVEFHPYLYQKDLLEYCRSKNIVLQAYSSLGIGKLVRDPAFSNIGTKYSKSSAQILYRWAIEHDVAILPKSTNAKHLSENVDVFKFNLSAEDVEAMDRLTNGTHFCWNPERVV